MNAMGGTVPGDPNLEHALLGAIIVSPDILGSVSQIVGPKDMTDGSSMLVYSAIMDLHKEGDHIDIVKVGHILKSSGHKNEIEMIASWVSDTPGLAGAISYARDIANIAAKRRIIRKMMVGASDLTKNHNGLEQVTTLAQSIVHELPDQSSNQPVPARQIVEEDQARMKERTEGNIFSTGVIDLDKWVDFGEPGMSIIAGRPSMGKSTLIRQIVRENCEHTTFHIYTLEDDPIVFLEAMACARAGVPMSKLWKGFASREDKNKIKFHMDYLTETNNIFFYPKYNVSAAMIHSHIQAMRPTHDRMAVVVDYIQQMDHPDADTLAQQIGLTARTLKLAALEFKIPIIVAAMLQRRCDDRPDACPVLNDLKDSGSLEQDADSVVFVYVQDIREEWRRADIAKRKRGRVARVKAMTFQQEIGVFSSMPADNMPAYEFERVAVKKSRKSKKKGEEGEVKKNEELPPFDPFSDDVHKEDRDIGF